MAFESQRLFFAFASLLVVRRALLRQILALRGRLFRIRGTARQREDLVRTALTRTPLGMQLRRLRLICIAPASLGL